MTTLTIRAGDTASALDEVLRRLGPDALILSTRQESGGVEVTAAPAGAEAPGETVATSFAGHFLHRLRGDAPPVAVLPPHLPRRLVLCGPPGAGVSMLAARLAAESLRLAEAPHPHLIAPRRDLLAAPGRLRGWVRLLGLVADEPFWPPGAPPAELPAPHADQCQIVDLSGVGPLSPQDLAGLAALAGTALWLVLPSGLHPAFQDRICAPLAGLAQCIALTRTDLCPPTDDDLTLTARHGIPVALQAQGPGLLDALSPLPPARPIGATPDAA